MRRILALVGIALMMCGGVRAYDTYDFVSHATQVDATVVTVETLQGPPKPRSRIPLHVSFTAPTGEERRTQVQMPLLQEIKEGAVIPILVDQRDAQRARLPIVSELWSVPLACAFAGIGALLLALLAPRKRAP